MVAVVAASGEALDRWRDLTRPGMPVYTSSDTSLKQLVRGSTALVRVNDGIITLKRNFATVEPDLLADPGKIDSLTVFDDGRVAMQLTLPFAAGILLLLLVGLWRNKKSDPVKSILRK